MNNLGTIYYAKKDFHRAERLYREAMKGMPDSAVVPKNLGTAYFAEAKFKRGAEAYRAAFAIDPRFLTDNPVQTIPEASSPVERASRDYYLAQLFAQAGLTQRAIEFLRKALDEGFTDRRRVMQDQEFAVLRTTNEFAQLMTEQKQR
jgi:tetratricopeptide (TPR) repeat protein